MVKKSFGKGIDAIFGDKNNVEQKGGNESKIEKKEIKEASGNDYKENIESRTVKNEKKSYAKACMQFETDVFEIFRAMSFWERKSYREFLNNTLREYFSLKDDEYVEKVLSEYREHIGSKKV